MAAIRYPRHSKEEFARRGNEIYEGDIRPKVDLPENRGKFVAIDIETGAWEMDADEMMADSRLFARVPDAQIWALRVGFGYLHRFGAGRPRSAA